MSNSLELKEEVPAPMNIATISAGFEKGDFLVREEQGNRVYFDFFEEVRFHVREVTSSAVSVAQHSFSTSVLIDRHSTTYLTRDMLAWLERTRSTGLTL